MKHKENISLFFSDISGTFDTFLDEESWKMYAEFQNILEEKRELLDADKILFSFVTADDRKEFVIKNIKIANEHLKSKNIEFGPHFFLNGSISSLDSGLYIIEEDTPSGLKHKKIANYVNGLKKSYNIISITFADDSANVSWYFDLVNELKDKSIKVELLIPSSGEIGNENIFTSPYTGFKGLLDCTRKSINKKEDKLWFIEDDDETKKIK